MQVEEIRAIPQGIRTRPQMLDKVFDNKFCKKCKLYQCAKNPYIEGRGNKNAKLLIIGEAPGKNEDEMGQVFVGSSGKTLQERLNRYDIDYYITNAVKCLDGKSLVKTKEGNKRINWIVKNKWDGEVLSINKDGEFVWKNIYGWHRSLINNRDIYKISIIDGKNNPNGKPNILVTEDHIIITERGEVLAKDLVSGKDKIATGTPYFGGHRSEQLIIGSLMGDAFVSNRNYLEERHSLKQREYLLLKTKLLEYWKPSISKGTIRNNKKSYSYIGYRISSTLFFKQLRKQFYKNGKKIFPEHYVNRLNIFGLAIIFMDDGYGRYYDNNKHSRSEDTFQVEIALGKIDEKSAKNIVNRFKELGYDVYVTNKDIYRLRFKYKKAYKFLKDIAKYVPHSMRYKLPESLRDYPFMESAYKPEKTKTYYSEINVSKVDYSKLSNSKSVYCIDVKDTHNFVTPSGVVHNCRPTDAQSKNRTPRPVEIKCCLPFTMKIIEEIKPKVILTLGRIPMSQILGLNLSMKIMRGHTYYHPELNVTIIPTYHPAYLGRVNDALYYKQFENDLLIANNLAYAPAKRILPPSPISMKDPIEIKEYLESLLNVDAIAIDLETSGTDHINDKITDISFCAKAGEGVHISWDDIIPHFELLSEVMMSDAVKVGQNFTFDIKFLRMAGVDVNNYSFDTLLAEHMLTMSYEKKEVSGLYKLKNMAWKGTPMGGYEEVLGSGGIKKAVKKKEKKKDEDVFQGNLFENPNEKKNEELEKFANVIDVIRKKKLEDSGLEPLEYYSAMDADVTFRLFQRQKPLIDKDFSFPFYEIVMPLSWTLMRVEENGIRLNSDYMNSIKIDNLENMERCKQELFNLAGKEFNLNSTDDLKDLIFNKLKITPSDEFKTKPSKTYPDGQYSTDEKAIAYYSSKNPALNFLIEYRKLYKENSTYIDGFKKFMQEDTWRVHPNYLQHSTATGRLSCISEGTKITMVGEERNIENVKVGDLVYCYDEKGELKISKVTNVFNNGIQDCIKLKWQSSGSGDIGELVLTPNHLVKHKYKGWIRADSLNRYDKIFHLRKSLQKNGRIRLYGTNKFMKFEEQVIKEEYFKAPSSLLIHHKDENPSNNKISNFEILSNSKHSKLHSIKLVKEGRIKWDHLDKYRDKIKRRTGKNHYYWKEFNKEDLIQMLENANGVISNLKIDKETFRNKCKLVGFDYKKYKYFYSKKVGYLDEKKIVNVLYKFEKESNSFDKCARYLGIGRSKLKELCDYYGISTNHMILSVTPFGKCKVYDLEVEEHHNFIANEICVHNCLSPPIQTIPRKNKIRNMIVPRDGGKLVVADLSQIELRILAMISGDQRMINAFESGVDFHTATACSMFRINPNEFDKNNSKHNEFRSVAKCVHPSSLIIYNLEIKRMCDIVKNSKEDSFEKIQGHIWNGKNIVDLKNTYKSNKGKRILISAHKSILVCSENHQVQLKDGSLKKAKDIKEKDVLCDVSFPDLVSMPQSIKINPFNGEDEQGLTLWLDEKWAYLAGVYTGDGCYAEKHISISTGSESKHEDWKDVLIKAFDDVGIYAKKRDSHFDKKRNRNSKSSSVYVGSTRTRRFFDKLELTKEGEGKTLRVPLWVLNNYDNCWAFLGGLLDTDGTVTTDPLSRTLSITTKSWELMQDLTVLLNRLGIEYGIENTFNKTYKRYYFRVQIYARNTEEIFNRKIMRCPYKVERLKKKVETLKNRRRSNHNKDNFVKRIEVLDEGDLFDIEVDSKDHLYWVNGIVTHNTINFGIAYGRGAYSIVVELRDFYGIDITQDEASNFINTFYGTYKDVKRWMIETVNFARTYGYVETIYGRKRFLPMIHSSNTEDKAKAERQAVNTMIQSSASDVNNIALIRIGKWLDDSNKKSMLIGCVHDSILVDSPEDEVEEVSEKLVECMTKDVPRITIPLKADLDILDKWEK